MNFSFFLAKRYLKSRKSQGFFSVMTMFSFLGIMLGVATLIIVMSVMNGFRLDVMSRVLGFKSHITLFSRDATAQQTKTVLDGLKKQDSVLFSAALIEQHAMVMGGDNPRFGLIRAMEFEDLQKKDLIAKNIKQGKLDAIKNGQIGVGKRLAEYLQLRIGDPLTIISPQGVSGMFGVIPRMASFKVGFVFETGARDYDDTAVFMPLGLAQTFFKMKDSTNLIEVFMKDASNADGLSRELFEKWGSLYQVMDWQRANTGLMAILVLERNVMFLVVGLIVLIASFNIITSLVMLVQQKTKDIAILRTIGATRKQIMHTFFFCGALLGVVGTFLGVTLGCLIAYNLDDIRRFIEKIFNVKLFPDDFWLTKMPAVLLTSDIINITLLSVTLSFLATIYPSWRAAKMKPVEALRYE